MSDEPVYFYPTLNHARVQESEPDQRVEPTTCTEAEPFVLRVLDDSMEPEFRSGCMIVIDPTGRATDGSYVLARHPSAEISTEIPVATAGDVAGDSVDDFIFASGDWVLNALNPNLSLDPVAVALKYIVGVIVQRAGTRRRYHKRYDG